MLHKSVISTISELRFKTEEVFQKAKHAPVYLLNRSTPKGVLLSLEKYQEFMDIIEDYFLSLKAGEYEKESKENTPYITQEKVKEMFK